MTDTARDRHDVIILGGGLAGLTLALQLRQSMPDIDVLVLERRTLPHPEAAHKVGESTVEIGAHYFASTLGLGAHMQQAQLRKFGFRFFFSEGRRDIDEVTELGPSRHLTLPGYQIDRGIFENFLAAEARRRGISFLDGARVRRVDLTESGAGADAEHAVAYEQHGEQYGAGARWVVDASGRAGLLRRKLDLDEANDHDAHAVWFRIGDRITIDRWSGDDAWQARCEPRARWLSTNHLVGTGYWVWLIPLSSGSHSVGIVADPARHPVDRMDTFDKAMNWLAVHQPLLFDDIDGKRDKLQDFACFRRFSYGCRQLFSANRWALTGEAGLFLDPLYSPGSDFIAIGNTYITELVATDRRGESLGMRPQVFDQIFHSFYENTLALYTDQYALLGDPEVWPIKVIWDNTYYWAILAQLFFHGRLTDMHALSGVRDELLHCQQLNLEVQDFLRRWSAVTDKHDPGGMLDLASMPWFAELNRSLDDTLDAGAFEQRIRKSGEQLRDLAREILERAIDDHPQLTATALRGLVNAGPSPGSGASPQVMLPRRVRAT